MSKVKTSPSFATHIIRARETVEKSMRLQPLPFSDIGEGWGMRFTCKAKCIVTRVRSGET